MRLNMLKILEPLTVEKEEIIKYFQENFKLEDNKSFIKIIYNKYLI